MTVYLVDRFVSDRTAPVYDQVVKQLRCDGFAARWSAVLPDPIRQDDMIITHDPIPTYVGRKDTHFLGQRLLNRQERLRLAEVVGLPVSPWSAPCSLHTAERLFDMWDTDQLVYKADWSFRRRGVVLWKRGEQLQLQRPYEPKADVFMPRLTGDPKTTKIDMFYTRVVGARDLPTPPICSAGFYGQSKPSTLVESTPLFMRIAERLGPAITRLGSGYYGVDLMETPNGPAIIEINSCGVGRMNTWPRWPGVFGLGYGSALRVLLATPNSAPLYSRVLKVYAAFADGDYSFV